MPPPPPFSPPRAHLSRPGFGALGAVIAAVALVIAIFWTRAQPGLLELLGGRAPNSYYNLLVEGFQAGQLNLRKEPPAAFVRLADPYDPAANHPFQYAPYLLHDLSYYRGKLYLYFGVTPALVLFWPWTALTGGYLRHREAVAIFCTVGFLASVGLLLGLWRRYFPEIPGWVGVAAVLALGLATSAPMLLQPAEIYEVAISCAYAFTMLALGAIWLALHRPAERGRWLAAASLAFGLALGARPSLLYATAVLLVPVVAARREPGRLRLLLAAALPLGLCGLGLAAYNFLRFGNPFEFGLTYQLANSRWGASQHFSLRYLWYNFRLNFLEPVPLSRNFPWIGKIAPPLAPAGYGSVEDPFGVLVDTPLTWLALAAPLAYRGQGEDARPMLRAFTAALALFFVLTAAPLLCFCWSASRYEMDFLPALVLLAVLGIFGLERALAPWPVRRRLVRAGWIILLAGAAAFNLLAGLDRSAQERCQYGNALLNAGRIPESMPEFHAALRIEPSYAEAHIGLGLALARSGRMPEAGAEFQEAVRGEAVPAATHLTLGTALIQLGQVAAAAVQYDQAQRLDPDSAVAHFDFAYALQLLGRRDEALAQFQIALRLDPTLAGRGR